MQRRLRVKLNMPVLIANFLRDERRALSEQEVTTWLKDAGFFQHEETYWIVSEPDLGQVEPDEVLEVEPLD